MTTPKPTAAPGETERHDREGGRQLAWVAAFFTVLTGGLVVWLGVWLGATSPMFVAVPVAGLVVTVLGFARPVFTIRLVSGRWGELDRAPTRPADRDPVAEKLDDGTPVVVAVAEEAVPDRARRARLGIGCMIGGAAVLALAGVLAWRKVLPADPAQWICTAAAGVAIFGLVVWYRTK